MKIEPSLRVREEETIVAPVIWQQHRNRAYCQVLPSAFFRAVSDYTALVPHLICQRGGHPFTPPYLGPALLPRLAGALPDHSGHAENPGKLSEILSLRTATMMMMMIRTIALATVAVLPLHSQEEELISSENSASIFNTLSDLPSQLRDGAELLGEAMRLAGTLSQDTLEAQRHKHLAYILSEQSQLNNGNGVPLNANLNKVGAAAVGLARSSGSCLS